MTGFLHSSKLVHFNAKKMAPLTRRFVQILTNLAFSSKGNGKLPRIAQSKLVRKMPIGVVQILRVKRQGKSPRGVPEEGSLIIF